MNKSSFNSRLSQNLYSIFVITRHEFLYNLFSYRMLTILILFTFGTLGGAYGLSYIILNSHQGALDVAFLRTPEDVVGGMSAIVSYLGSLMAIVFGFDSITREKTQGSLDFLLTRPVSKRGIMLGKFLGLWLGLTVPIILVSVGGIGIITYMVGAPQGKVIMAYFFLTPLFVGTFISFQQIFSSLARNVMEALVTGIMIFLLYSMFWMLFPYGWGYAMGLDVQEPTVERDILIDIFNLFYPNGAFQSALSGWVNPDYVHGMHWLVPTFALVVWFIGTLLVNIEVFNRKV